MLQCSITSKLTPVDMVRIVECAATDKGDQLLNLYGNHTQEFVHWMKGTPAVAINGVCYSHLLSDFKV